MASQYPTAIDDQSTLYNPADSFSTKPLLSTLGASCLDTDTTIQMAATLASLGAPAAYGILSIDDEQILYTGSSGVNATGCIRGAFGTTAIGHSSGAAVRWRYVKAFDAALQAAVIAIQTTLGVEGDYNFLDGPAGSDKQVQFNDGGDLGADAGLTYDKTEDVVTNLSTSTGTARGIASRQTNSGTQAALFQGVKARGTPGSESAVQANDTLTTIAMRGHDGTVDTVRGAQIYASATENWGASAHGAKLKIGTCPNGSSTTTDALEVGQDQNVDAMVSLSVAGGQKITSVTTSVAASGSAAKLPTESAVRTAISPGVNAQTGTSYTYADGDRGKLVTHSNASSIAGTLPQAGASSLFLSGWFVDIENRGAGTLTITPTTSTIDGAASLSITTNKGVRLFSDGTNYFTQRGMGGSGTGDVVGPGSATNDHIPQFDGTTGKLLKDGLGLVTTVGSPGSDSNVPSEQGVREAISSIVPGVDCLFSDVSGGSSSATSEETLASVATSGPSNGSGRRIRCHVLVTGDTTYSFAVRLKFGGTVIAEYNSSWSGSDFAILIDAVVMGISGSAAKASSQVTTTGGVYIATYSLTSLSNTNVEVTFEPTALSDATTGICKMLLVEVLRPGIHFE